MRRLVVLLLLSLAVVSNLWAKKDAIGDLSYSVVEVTAVDGID